MMVRINDRLDVPEDELQFRYSRSSGPGGQNVNKVATKVTLLFDLRSSPSLDDEQRGRISERLDKRISKHGVLHLSSDRHRTRGANQRAVIERFAELMADALRERTPRRRTRVPEKEKRRRRDAKRRRSQVKAMRGRPSADD
jgi:ribosome-associated protein